MTVADVVQQANKELAESLLKCRVEGNTVFLPPMSEGPLANYQDVRKALLNAGAKYKRNTFIFEGDAQSYIDRLVSGESVNLKKEFQFFPTPADIAVMMISYLPPVAAEAKILEPSAGDGALVKAFTSAYPINNVDCYEIMEINRKKLLTVLGARIVGEDFLMCDKTVYKDYYDIIIANPPFTNNQDIDHIRQMYEVLKPGGTIITLASPSWTFGSQKKQVQFKQWLEELDVFPKTLPDKSFVSSGTKIIPVLLQIQKAGAIVSSSSQGVVSGAVIPGPNTTKDLDACLGNERRCRVCGCTDNDCRQCIEKTGQPCHWVEEDLCSACVEEVHAKAPQTLPAGEIKTENEPEVVEESPTVPPVTSSGDAYQEYLANRDKQNSSPITFTEMKFFEQLEMMGPGVDITLRIKEKNGKYTVGVSPEVANKSRLKPLNVTGTAAELDADFFPKVGPIIHDTKMIIQNADEHKKSVEETVKKDQKPAAAASTSSGTTKSKKRTPAKKSTPKKAATKKAEKKPAPKKAAAKKEAKPPVKKETAKPEDVKPKVQEQALF